GIKAFKPGISVAAPATLQQLIQKEVSAQLRRQQAPMPAPTPPPAHERSNTVLQESSDTPPAPATARPAGRPGVLRPRILALLEAHPEGLYTVEIRTHLGLEAGEPI